MENTTIARLQAVTHSYGNVTALGDVTLDLPAGRLLGLIGPDGVGKSTLLDMLAGARKIQTGKVEVLGSDMDQRVHRDAVFSHIAYMPQGLSKNLYQVLSVRENLDFFGRLFDMPGEAIEPRIAELLEDFDLGLYADSFAGELPLGLRQRLPLACAIIRRPDMVILDEPTSGVDPVARDECWDILARLSRDDKVTIFISIHFMNEEMRCNGISLMHASEVLVYDTPENLAIENGSKSLNETFIRYITQAMDELEIATQKLSGITSDAPKRPRNAGLTRLLAVGRREMLEIRRL